MPPPQPPINAFNDKGELCDEVWMNIAEMLTLRLPEGVGETFSRLLQISPIFDTTFCSQEKITASKWVKKFQACRSNAAKKYLSLFIHSLTKQILVEPFNDPPADTTATWVNFQKQYTLNDINKAVQQRIFKDSFKPPYQIEISQDLQEYVAFQEIPLFGAHFYYAFSPNSKINTWHNFDSFKVPPKYVKALVELGEIERRALESPVKIRFSAAPRPRVEVQNTVQKSAKKKEKRTRPDFTVGNVSESVQPEAQQQQPQQQQKREESNVSEIAKKSKKIQQLFQRQLETDAKNKAKQAAEAEKKKMIEQENRKRAQEERAMRELKLKKVLGSTKYKAEGIKKTKPQPKASVGANAAGSAKAGGSANAGGSTKAGGSEKPKTAPESKASVGKKAGGSGVVREKPWLRNKASGSGLSKSRTGSRVSIGNKPGGSGAAKPGSAVKAPVGAKAVTIDESRAVSAPETAASVATAATVVPESAVVPESDTDSEVEAEAHVFKTPEKQDFSKAGPYVPLTFIEQLRRDARITNLLKKSQKQRKLFQLHKTKHEKEDKMFQSQISDETPNERKRIMVADLLDNSVVSRSQYEEARRDQEANEIADYALALNTERLGTDLMEEIYNREHDLAHQVESVLATADTLIPEEAKASNRGRTLRANSSAIIRYRLSEQNTLRENYRRQMLIPKVNTSSSVQPVVHDLMEFPMEPPDLMEFPDDEGDGGLNTRTMPPAESDPTASQSKLFERFVAKAQEDEFLDDFEIELEELDKTIEQLERSKEKAETIEEQNAIIEDINDLTERREQIVEEQKNIELEEELKMQAFAKHSNF